MFTLLNMFTTKMYDIPTRYTCHLFLSSKTRLNFETGARRWRTVSAKHATRHLHVLPSHKKIHSHTSARRFLGMPGDFVTALILNRVRCRTCQRNYYGNFMEMAEIARQGQGNGCAHGAAAAARCLAEPGVVWCCRG